MSSWVKRKIKFAAMSVDLIRVRTIRKACVREDEGTIGI
jgi:hypothetical protein